MRTCLALVLLTVVFIASLSAGLAAPKFSDYVVTTKFAGKPVPPVLSTPRARMFRTELRRQAATGPNFAGHFTLARWGCGAGCVYVAVIDASSGEVFMPELSFETVAARPGREACHHGSDFEIDSELFIAQGQIRDKVGRHYFRWKEGRFTPVHFEVGCV
jgi:hypothetical protein